MSELDETKVIDKDLLKKLLEVCKLDETEMESRMQSDED